MSFKITARTRSILNQIQKNPSVVLDVEGIDLLISSSVVFEKITWDNDNGVTWDYPGATWDGSIASAGTKSYINLKESTRAITQQIYPDKKGSSSITAVRLTIVDKNRQISNAFALNTINEILGKKCTYSLGFVGANYPEDYLPVMNGIITGYAYKGGAVQMTIAHADTLRRQAILTEYNSQLTASIDAVQTAIPVATTEKLLPPLDSLESYIRIDDEIMQVVSIDSDIQITVVRGVLNTIDASHDNDSEITSNYRLVDNPLTLAQKIMQSDGSQSFFESDIALLNFQYVSPTETIQNAIIFDDEDIERSTGLIPDDIIEVDTYGQFTVNGFGKLDDGNSYILVKEDLTTIADVNEPWRFKSQYNVLNFGLGMFPFEVDNAEFEFTKNTYSPNFTTMTFPITSGIDNARDFINEQLYFVAGCYGIPRNARSSVKFLAQPLTIEELPTLNETNVLNMIKLAPKRSVNKFYYNDILFEFNKSIKDDEYKSFSEFINDDSFDRFGMGKKQLRISADGFIRSTETDLILDRLAGRFLDRYSNAATFIKGVELPFKVGFNIQVGSVVVFGGAGTKLVDYNTGLRNLPIAKYEVINQKINLDGVVSLDILSTGFGISGTLGVFSPSSKIADGTTLTTLVLDKISNLDEFTFERDKWASLINVKIRVRSEDYFYDEKTVITALSAQNPNGIDVEALPSLPPQGAIVELAEYDDYELKGENDTDDTVKEKYTFTMNQDGVSVAIDNQNFEVSNIGDFFEGQKIAVHSDDFTRDEFEATIETILGNVITLTETLDFIPQVGDKVESRANTDQDGYLFA